MMIAANLPPDDTTDIIGPVIQKLQDGDEVVRCAAARALAALNEEGAAAALVEALLDEDPDVRTDAMGALTRCARPEDADAIRRSLLGDPVKEVKISAIGALARLADAPSVPLLAALAKDRCDHDVAWEDEAGMWDDWLDVQIAAVTALGAMKFESVVEDLLVARDDEMGQELDDVVFAALARIPDAGIAALLALLHDGAVRVREQALSALSRAQPETLAPLMDLLLKDASAEVRCLAAKSLDPDNPSLEKLLRDDPSAQVRRAAFRKLGSGRPDLALLALKDSDEEIRSLALDVLLTDPAADLPADLAVNVQAWMTAARPVLAATCAGHLSTLSGADAFEPLRALAEQSDGAMEVRISAIRSLQGLNLPEVAAFLENAIKDPVRQVRAAALAALAGLTKSEEPAVANRARALLAAAIEGDADAERGQATHTSDEVLDSLSASKVDEVGVARIKISRDGDILRDDQTGEDGAPESNVIDLRFPTSTLAAIQEPAVHEPPEDDDPQIESPRAGDGPNLSSRGKGKHHRRVAVDGPDNIALDLRLVAIRVAADCLGEEIESALCDAAVSSDAAIRTAAYSALARRCENLPPTPAILPLLIAGLTDEDPLIRGHAVQAAGNSNQIEEAQIAALLDDPDAVVRASALKALRGALGEQFFVALKDSSALVRRTAIEALLAEGSAPDLERTLRICLECSWVDSLTEVCKRSPGARGLLLSTLHDQALERKQTLVVLEAVALA